MYVYYCYIERKPEPEQIAQAYDGLSCFSSWTVPDSVPFSVLASRCFCTFCLWFRCLQWHIADILSKEIQGSCG